MSKHKYFKTRVRVTKSKAWHKAGEEHEVASWYGVENAGVDWNGDHYGYYILLEDEGKYTKRCIQFDQGEELTKRKPYKFKY